MNNIETDLDIFKENKFYIERIENNMYIFYNSIRHFACKISELDLYIFNLIYKYKELEIIKNNINIEFHKYITNLYQKVIKSKVLSLEKIDSNIIYQLPSSFYLHLTYKCNLGCIYCYNKDIRTDYKDLDVNRWEYIIDQIIPYAERIVLTGGEPFLFNKLCNIIQYIRNKSQSILIEIISNCMIDFENYSYLNDIVKNINSITFSCDNLTDVNQTRINFNSNLFKKNIILLKNKYPQLNITISSVYIKNSENEIGIICKFCQEVNTGFKSVLITPNNKKEIELLPNINNYKKSFVNKVSKLENLRKYCGAGIGSCSIDPKGNVYPCQSLHYSKFEYGNILNESIDNILKNKKSQSIRNQYNVDLIDTCKECNLKYICGAGCRAATYKLEGDPMKYPKTLCSYYRELSIHKLKNIPLISLY